MSKRSSKKRIENYGHNFCKIGPDESILFEEWADRKWYRCSRCGLVSYLPNPSFLYLNNCDEMICRGIMSS
jgi:hypothetical protein